MFFFEKKNQKTFVHGLTWPKLTWPKLTWVADAQERKFFVSFFQKRRPFFLEV
jgi:hypothetical protein